MTEFAATETRVSIAGFDVEAAGVTPPSNPHRRGVFLADVVVELGFADQETIDQAVQEAQKAEKSLERHLLDAAILDEDRLSRAIAERNGLDHVDLDQFEVDTEAAELVTRSAAQRYSAVPVAFASDGALIVAVQDPFDSLGISDIEVMTRSEARPAIATASEIRALIESLPERPVTKPQPPQQPEPVVEPPAEDDEVVSLPPPTAPVPDPAANGDFAPRPLSEPELEPEPEPDASENEHDAPELEAFDEPVAVEEIEVEVEVEPEPRLVEFPEPELSVVEEEEKEDEAEDDEPVLPLPPIANGDSGIGMLHEAEPAPAPSGELADLTPELRALQETARRSDELALTVERRVDELKRADDRSKQLERDLLAAERRVDELEQRLTGVDTVAEELRATTEKLEEVNRVLEGSAR